MIKSISAVLILVLLTLSCSSTKIVNDTTETVAENGNSDSKNNYSLIVSFYSPGNGIDGKVKKEYTVFLTNSYPKVVYEEAKWGKEGEIDFCFQLDELTESQKEQFIKESLELLSKSKKVNTYQNAPCRNKKSP